MSLSFTGGFLANLFFGLILAGDGIFLAWHHPHGGFVWMLFVLVSGYCIWRWQARMLFRRGEEVFLGRAVHRDLASQGN